ncbi:hypothetical protein M422DRAFT_26158 [Sphaerobolus stellatus SS14]|nr:hypothetical protein M422DRAFT_26158 [Sphaerobolus stellatus SS14]
MIRPVASVRTNLTETYLAWKAKDMEAEESGISARIAAEAQKPEPEEVTEVEAVPNIAVVG